MRRAFVTCLCLVAAVLMMADFVWSQDLHPSRRPSPMGMTRVMLDDCYVRVVYSRPYKRNRENIFGTKESGALVPYGDVWRTGANEATEITVTKDVMVAGKKLPAGTYSLFTTPGPNTWTVHFNSTLNLSGTVFFDPETGKVDPGYFPKNDVLVVSAASSALEKEVDQFTVSFEKADDGAHMVLRWIKTEVRVPFALAR